MGKKLIIKGADFSENCIDTEGTILMRKSKIGCGYLNYQITVNSIIRNTSSTSKLFVFDVSNVNGRTVRITSCHKLVSGASYNCFSTDLGTLSFNDIPSLSGSDAPADASQSLRVSVGAIENFNISSADNVYSMVTKEVPTGANYLLLGFSTTGNLQESDVAVELVES